jgi:hypothetical protein
MNRAVTARAPVLAADDNTAGKPTPKPGHDARLDVHPFYRDGAYKARVFTVHDR